jgi:hypothetical protein
MQVTDSMISEIDVSKDSATLAIAVESLLSWRNQKKKQEEEKITIPLKIRCFFFLSLIIGMKLQLRA